ncbi:TPA: hypothetical protein VDU83_002537 [Pseudomonas aeruginosa]|nr:hypothetical protein [Pseudomonas aeruginosa]
MWYEKTSELNPQRLTIKQHFHMKAVLKNFVEEEGIKVTRLSDGVVSFHDADDEIFLGLRSWSQQAEVDLSHPIEERFLNEVRRIVKGTDVIHHDAVSQYHLLWTLRHHYAKNPVQETAVFPAGFGGELTVEFEELAESLRKVPIRQGGKIAGRFIATKHLEQDLTFPDNVKNYQGIYWNVLQSDTARLISADCYGDCLLMAVSPHLILKGAYAPQPRVILSAEDVELFNDESAHCAVDFTIG